MQVSADDPGTRRQPKPRDGFSDLQGFIFVSSANSTTPFHIDMEENVLVNIRGEKFVHLFDNADGALVSEEAREIAPSKHRNQHYEPSFEDRAQVFTLNAGDGVHIPYTQPHWVRTGADSLAPTGPDAAGYLTGGRDATQDDLSRKPGAPRTG